MACTAVRFSAKMTAHHQVGKSDVSQYEGGVWTLRDLAWPQSYNG